VEVRGALQKRREGKIAFQMSSFEPLKKFKKWNLSEMLAFFRLGCYSMGTAVAMRSGLLAGLRPLNTSMGSIKELHFSTIPLFLPVCFPLSSFHPSALLCRPA
jgi:hypothetical protein